MKIIPPFRPVSGDSPSPEKPSSQSNHHHHSFSQHHHHHHSHSSKSSEDLKNPPGNNSTKMKSSSSSSSSSSSTSNSSSKVTTTTSSNPSSNISPDIAAKNKVSSKRGGSYNGNGSSITASGNNSGSYSELNRRNSSSPIPRIAPSNLFSSGAFASSLNNDSGEPDKPPVKLKSPASVSVSLERIDDKRNTSSGNSGLVTATSYMGHHHKKEINEVTSSSSAAQSPVDRTAGGASSSGNKKYDHPTDKEGLAAKLPPPPDIKPHVTLTPIPPVRTPTQPGEHGPKNEKGYPISCSSNGSSCSSTSSASYGGPPMLQNQRKDVSPDMTEIPAKGGKGPPELTLAEFPGAEKNGVPPNKRSRYVAVTFNLLSIFSPR